MSRGPARVVRHYAPGEGKSTAMTHPCAAKAFDKFMDEDIETAVYIRGTYDPVEIARIGDISLTAKNLKRNLDDKYIYGDVSPLYSVLHHYCNNCLIIV